MKITQEDLRLYVGEKADYYIPQWSKIEQTGKKFNINWASFFAYILTSFLLSFFIVLSLESKKIEYSNLPFYYFIIIPITYYLRYIWFVNKKIYLYSLYLSICFFVIEQLVTFLFFYFIDFDNTIFGWKPSTLFFVIFTFWFLIQSFIISGFTNYIYYKSAIKNITKIKEKLIDTDKQRIEIDKSAGTLIDWIQTLPKTVRETTFPILIAIITFLFTLTFMDLRCSKNIEYQLTDVTKFAIKDHKEPKTGDDPSEWLDSEIMILGISETSQFQYLNRIYGQFPWPRETYADFLSYFRLDDERLQIPQDQLDEIKFLTWNSINPQIVFFDIFFDAPRNTSISYEKRSLQNDFGKLINMLEKLNKPEKKQKTTSVKNKNKIKKSKKQFAKKPLKLDYKTILKTTILDWANEKKNESDQKFFDELKRQKNKNYIFVDYPLASEKEGRLEEDTVKIGYSFLSKWELKNVFDRYGKKINVPKTEHDIIDYPPIAYDIKAPLVNITKNIAGAGAANILQDPDGKRRRMPLIYRIYDERIMVEPVFVPTVGLIMAMKYYNIEPKDIIVKLGSSIVLNNATLKKRINYTRKGKDKVYNWTEFIDPFMDIIIKDIISMANSTGTTSGDFKLNYETLFKRLLNNKILENSLIEKFKKNNLEINVTKELFKREINDFLNSLSITAFFKQNDFFQVEDKNFKKIDTSKLKKYYDTFDKEHKILKNLVEKKIVQKEDLSREAKILFLGTEEAKISYKDIRYEKGGFYATVAQLVSGNISLKPEELNQVLQDLINKNYITPLNENDYKIVNIDELEKYKASLNDEKVKSIIDYLISSLELPFISKELQNKKLITFNEEKGNFFTVSDINSLKDFHKKIPSKNNEEKVIIQYIIDWMGFGDATINANDMYRELETQFKINPAKSKNVIENLIKNNLISFPSYVFFEIPNLKKLHEYKDSFIKRIFHRKIINKMIETADRIIEIAGIGGKYYSLKTETVLNYINSKTGISKKEIREILHKIKIDKKIDKKFKSIRILINPKEVKDEEVKIEDYEEIIKYYQHVNNKNQIFNALLMLSKDKSESLPYQKTLLDISRLTNIYPRVVLYIIREIIDNKIIEIEHLKEDKRIIKANLETLLSYRLTKQNIEIPIDNKGQLVINFQGKHRSFENEHFGKHMGLSRNRLIKNGINNPYPYDNNDLTPYNDFEKFKNKIVFIGFYTTAGLGESRDYFETPYDTLFGIEIHANAFYTLISRDFIKILPGSEASSFNYESLLMIFFALLFGISLPKLSILRGFLFFAVSILIFWGLNLFLVFAELRVNIPLLGTTLTMFFTFIVLIVYKLMTEEKEKRKIKSTFSKYVSPDVVNSILNSSKKLVLGGESKVITVMFSDIRGFTTLSEGLTSQELVNHLNNYLSAMTDIALKYKGTLDKYIGDAIMAFWGAPLDIPDHAILACKASLDMIEKLDELNKDWPDKLKIRIGIGLNTGEMTVGNMGSASRMDYTIMGDNVNLGSRVEGVNKMYGTEIIITESTYEQVKENVIVRELDLIKVKGKEKPVKIFELLAIK